MTFIKYFRNQRRESGQSVLEYFVIFAVIALLGFVSISSHYDKIRHAMQGTGGYSDKAMGIDGLNLKNE